MNEHVANIIEALLELEQADGDTLQADVIRENVGALYNKAVDRTLMLQMFIGMAQQRVWPAIETINKARALLGMHGLESLPSN